MGTESPSKRPSATSQAPPLDLEARLRRVGQDLSSTLPALLETLGSSSWRPGDLAKRLGVNRAVTSKLLAAMAKPNPMEVLHLIPGPEPLRKVLAAVDAGGGTSASADASSAASVAIEAFAELIDEEAGTRPALEALIAPHLPGAAGKLELASRYSIYRGMSQLKGAQAELWLGTAVVVPSPTDPERLDLTWLSGAHAIQRLRPMVDVRFSYRLHRGGADPDHPPEPSILSLERFCLLPMARLETHTAGESIQYTLPDDLLGPKARTDLFVVDHHPASMRRYAGPEAVAAGRTRTSLFVEPAIPVARLQFDVLLHDDVFPGADPELFFYDTGNDGIANVNDRTRDLDRVTMVDRPELLGHGLERFGTAGLSTYGPMLAHLAEHFGWDGARLRGYRLSQGYPVHGWQTSMAFRQPAAP